MPVPSNGYGSDAASVPVVLVTVTYESYAAARGTDCALTWPSASMKRWL